MPVVLVTGTSTGIGLATALHFARRGDTVFAGVRDPASAPELHAALARERLPVHVLPLDVNDDAAVARGVQEAVDRAGRIDVLVNNAGVGGGGSMEDVPVDFARAMFETNYFGAIRMIRAVLPGMRARRSGAIVNVSSVFGRLVAAGHGHYAAAKHALEAASEALAQEVYELGIRVVVVEPGVVATPIFAKARRFADADSPYALHLHRLMLLYRQLMQAPSQPSDVAEVIHEAVTTSRPRLRWVVGQDAEKLIAGRSRVTDEEYVATGRAMSDEAYLDLTRRRYGFDW